jgi:hypothetical protein
MLKNKIKKKKNEDFLKKIIKKFDENVFQNYLDFLFKKK